MSPDKPARLTPAEMAGHIAWMVQRRIADVRYALTPGDDPRANNAMYLLIEIFWAAFLSAAAAFNAPFALRLGATNADIGLLSSIPALLAILVTLPAGQFLTRQRKRMPWLLGSLLLSRIGYLLVIFIPWLPFGNQGAGLVWLLIVFTIPAHFFNVAWGPMLADVVPETDRARVFALRNILLAGVVTVGVFLAGRWLQSVPFPLNYQIMYGVGFAAAMVSTYYLTRLKVPESHVPEPPAQALGPLALLRGWRDAFTTEPDFTRITLNTLMHGIGLWMIGPVYVLYYVRTLGAEEGWLGLNSMMANLTPIIGYYLWQRGVMRLGENKVLRWTIMAIGVYPILVGIAPSLTVILMFTALYGLVAPAVNLSHYPMLLKICPAAQRPVFLALYTTIMNIGAFIMPLIGVKLAEAIGPAPVIIAGGVLSALGSSSFVWNRLRTADTLALRRREMAEPHPAAE